MVFKICFCLLFKIALCYILTKYPTNTFAHCTSCLLTDSELFLKSRSSSILHCFFTLFFECLIFKCLFYCYISSLSRFLIVLVFKTSFWSLHLTFISIIFCFLFFCTEQIIKEPFIYSFLCLRRLLHFFFLLLLFNICFDFFFFRILFLHPKEVVHYWLFFLVSLLRTTFGSLCFIFYLDRTLLNFLFFGLVLLCLFQLFLSDYSPFLYIFNPNLWESRMSEQKLLSFE